MDAQGAQHATARLPPCGPEPSGGGPSPRLREARRRVRGSLPGFLTTGHLPVEASKRVDDLQPFKPAEVAVAGDKLRNPVLEAEGNNVSVVDQISGGARLAKDLFEDGSVSYRFGEQKERRRG